MSWQRHTSNERTSRRFRKRSSDPTLLRDKSMNEYEVPIAFNFQISVPKPGKRVCIVSIFKVSREHLRVEPRLHLGQRELLRMQTPEFGVGLT